MQSRTHRQGRRWWISALLTTSLTLGAMALLASTAPHELQARDRKPEDVFKTRIVINDSPFPPRFSSDAAFVKYVKKVDQKEFWPKSEAGAWEIHYMAFFKAPLPQKNYLVQFFDITDADPVLIVQSTTYTSQPGQRIMVGDYALDKQLFQGNRKILMVMLLGPGQPALAEAEFVLRPYDPQHIHHAPPTTTAEDKKDKPASKAPTWTPPEW